MRGSLSYQPNSYRLVEYQCVKYNASKWFMCRTLTYHRNRVGHFSPGKNHKYSLKNTTMCNSKQDFFIIKSSLEDLIFSAGTTSIYVIFTVHLSKTTCVSPRLFIFFHCTRGVRMDGFRAPPPHQPILSS